ncbi:PIN domain-containing protein [Candidatus Woesearchaeota archaeon]|nr:PIN domain-containing protein [Candidatus Woesearchaeota archaeon]
MILETTFLIDLLRGRQEAVSKMKELEGSHLPLFIATPSIVELWSGIVRFNRPQSEKIKILQTISEQLILDLTKEAAVEAGKIDGTLVKTGKEIEPEDSMIAGIAITNHEAVLTRNTEHFRRVMGLTTERY